MNFGWKTWAVAVPFLLLYWLNMWHHTMFFDEVNAWAISAASPTLSKLFYYVHFEGHPWLWYFILWFPSRLTHDPVAMKWVEAVFGTAILLIIGILSPFTLKQRALVLSGYFLLWEYTVMCRMYSVMLLLALLYVLRRVSRPEGIAGNCLLLGLIANADMTGFLLASALLIEYLFQSYVMTPAAERSVWLRRWLAGLFVYVALVGLSVATLWPSKQISWQSSGHLGANALNRHWIDSSLGDVVAAPWWPISPQFPRYFWETRVADAHWLYVLVPIVLFTYWRTFRRDRNLLILMGSVLLAGFLFADIVYKGSVRNWGIAYVALLIGLWIQGSRKRSSGATPSWPAMIYGLLGLSAVAGVFATAGSWSHPFSRAREAADWVEKNNPAWSPLMGLPDVSFASVAEEMQRPVYFLECGCVDTFKLFSRDRESLREDQVPARVNQAMSALHTQEVTFVLYRPLESEDLKWLEEGHLRATPLASFAGAEVNTENFYVYSIRAVPPESQGRFAEN